LWKLDEEMSCTHREPGKYVYVEDDWDPSYYTEEWVEGKSTQADISIGAFKCTQCGEIGYYTDKWKNYHENGVPCFGSETVPRNTT
jgi:hypothetical protein